MGIGKCRREVDCANVVQRSSSSSTWSASPTPPRPPTLLPPPPLFFALYRVTTIPSECRASSWALVAMPRRSSARTAATAAIDAPAASEPVVPSDPVSENLHQLRHHWKWAAFCQFFFIFFDLFAINDISLDVCSPRPLSSAPSDLTSVASRTSRTTSFMAQTSSFLA